MNNEKRLQKQTEFANVLKDNRGIFLSSIRFGKTATILMTLLDKEGETLICYPKLEIKASWTKEVDRVSFKGELVYSSFASLKKLVAAGKKFKRIIIDEIAKLSPKQWEYINILIDGDRILGLTGVMRESKIRVWNKRGMPVLIRYDLKDAINDSLVKDYQIYVHFEPMNNISYTKQFKKFGNIVFGTEKQVYDFYTSQMNYFDEKSKREDLTPEECLAALMGYKKYMGLRTNFIYNSETLLAKAQRLIASFVDKKVLIFSLRTAVADELGESYHSKNKGESFEEFKISENGHLSTVNMVSEGVTIKNLNTIVCHTITSNTEDFQQKLGRGLLLGEIDDEVCQVHVICLTGTQQEKWVDEASKSLDATKILYVFKDRTVLKLDYIKETNPGLVLYLYQGSICYYSSDNELGFAQYKFLGDNIDREYAINIKKLTKI